MALLLRMADIPARVMTGSRRARRTPRPASTSSATSTPLLVEVFTPTRAGSPSTRRPRPHRTRRQPADPPTFRQREGLVPAVRRRPAPSAARASPPPVRTGGRGGCSPRSARSSCSPGRPAACWRSAAGAARPTGPDRTRAGTERTRRTPAPAPPCTRSSALFRHPAAAGHVAHCARAATATRRSARPAPSAAGCAPNSAAGAASLVVSAPGGPCHRAGGFWAYNRRMDDV